MLKIGDFSRLTHISVRMLRHYDELGLLKPAHIDRESGYRYYSADQLGRLNRILALQDLGLSLKQIGVILEQPLSTEQLRGMLLQKQSELADRLREEQERLARVAGRLRQLEQKPEESPDVIIKEVPAQWVAAVRGHISTHDSIGPLYDPLFAHLAPHRIQGVTGAIWHDDSYLEAGIDAEAFVLLPGPLPASALVQVYELPALRVASVVHQGAYSRMNDAYTALLHWLDRSGYHINGPNRELYLHYELPARPDNESYITEIQFPVTWAGSNEESERLRG